MGERDSGGRGIVGERDSWGRGIVGEKDSVPKIRQSSVLYI